MPLWRPGESRPRWRPGRQRGATAGEHRCEEKERQISGGIPAGPTSVPCTAHLIPPWRFGRPSALRGAGRGSSGRCQCARALFRGSLRTAPPRSAQLRRGSSGRSRLGSSLTAAPRLVDGRVPTSMNVEATPTVIRSPYHRSAPRRAGRSGPGAAPPSGWRRTPASCRRRTPP